MCTVFRTIINFSVVARFKFWAHGTAGRYRNTLQLGPHPSRAIFAMDKIAGTIAFMGRFSNDSNILVS